MNPHLSRHLLLSCLLIISVTTGCTTYRREPFLESHSLDRFIADRPQAGKLLEQHPALDQWLRAEWNRPIADCRIYWSNDQPAANPTAEHGLIPEYRLILIRVSRKLPPVDQLLALSYEVCNAQECSGIEELNARAAAGKITRKDYQDEINAREHTAALRIKETFPRLFPLSSNELAATILYRVFLEVPADFHEYQAWIIRTGSAGYLQNQVLYGEQYDRLTGKR